MALPEIIPFSLAFLGVFFLLRKRFPASALQWLEDITKAAGALLLLAALGLYCYRTGWLDGLGQGLSILAITAWLVVAGERWIPQMMNLAATLVGVAGAVKACVWLGSGLG